MVMITMMRMVNITFAKMVIMDNDEDADGADDNEEEGDDSDG